MKVLHFYKTYLPNTIGGAEQAINQIVKSTAEFGVEAEVLTLTPDNDVSTVDVDGHKSHRCKSIIEVASTPFSLTVFKRFKELAKEADIIHYHFPYPFADMVHFLTGVKKPSVVSYHSDVIKQKHLLKIYTPLMNKFLSSVDVLVAASPQYTETSQTLRRYSDKTKVIPYGLYMDSYPAITESDVQKCKEKYGDKFFLFVGVLRYYKGLHILINAAKNSSYPIVIAGTGPLEAELKQQVQGLGLTNVIFAGFISDEEKVALITACYAFVFPSHLRSEAFGISLLEAAMYGKPMISAEIGTGTTYININNKTGLVVERDNPIDLHNAMKTLWDDEKSAQKMGEMARERYLELFTAQKMGERYTEIYKGLLEG
jgi:rhamnosyl/mannosyltransferase